MELGVVPFMCLLTCTCDGIHLGGLSRHHHIGDVSWVFSTPRPPIPGSLHLLGLQLKPSLSGLRAPEHPRFTPSLSVLIQIGTQGARGVLVITLFAWPFRSSVGAQSTAQPWHTDPVTPIHARHKSFGSFGRAKVNPAAYKMLGLTFSALGINQTASNLYQSWVGRPTAIAGPKTTLVGSAYDPLYRLPVIQLNDINRAKSSNLTNTFPNPISTAQSSESIFLPRLYGRFVWRLRRRRNWSLVTMPCRDLTSQPNPHRTSEQGRNTFGRIQDCIVTEAVLTNRQVDDRPHVEVEHHCVRANLGPGSEILLHSTGQSVKAQWNELYGEKKYILMNIQSNSNGAGTDEPLALGSSNGCRVWSWRVMRSLLAYTNKRQ